MKTKPAGPDLWQTCPTCKNLGITTKAGKRTRCTDCRQMRVTPHPLTVAQVEQLAATVEAGRREYQPAPPPLVDAVAAMRSAQREYFRTRSQSALRAAKTAEARVDRLLEAETEPSLFD